MTYLATFIFRDQYKDSYSKPVRITAKSYYEAAQKFGGYHVVDGEIMPRNWICLGGFNCPSEGEYVLFECHGHNLKLEKGAEA